MNGKKVLKTTLWVFTCALVLTICFFSYHYYQNVGRHESRSNKYPHYIGFINQETALLNNKDQLCNATNIYGTHHGLPKMCFKLSKKHFRETIKSTYKNRNYTDSGYLNFRFLVNCEGIAGWFEIIKMNLNLEASKLNDDMVNQLLDITSKYNGWSSLKNSNGEPFDYYMYISYRIEHGEVTEILP